MARAVCSMQSSKVIENVWHVRPTSATCRGLRRTSGPEQQQEQQQALCQMQPLAMRTSLCLAAWQKMEL